MAEVDGTAREGKVITARTVLERALSELPDPDATLERLEVQQATPTHYMCRIQEAYGQEARAFAIRIE